jgi:hypothetical protein
VPIFSKRVHGFIRIWLWFEGHFLFGPRNPRLLWLLRWLSVLEEFCGLDAAKKELIALLRCFQVDAVDITHLCCHRGKGIVVVPEIWDEVRPQRPGEDGIDDILDEETELIGVLEDDVHAMQSKSFGALRAEFMSLLKDRYDTCVSAWRACEGGREAKRKAGAPPPVSLSHKASACAAQKIHEAYSN